MNPEEKKAIRWAVENTDFRYPISIKTVKEAFLAGYLLAKDEEIAIEFGMWIGNQIDYECKTYGRWTSTLEDISTKQLFDLFINSKNKK